MTLNQLREDVLALGFEESMADDMPFIPAVNRAMRTITSRFPEVRVKTFIHVLRTPKSRIPLILHKAGEEETFTLEGKSFSFKVSGEGAYRFTDGEGESGGSFCTELGAVRGFINGIGKLTLLGDLCYNVTDLVTYADSFGRDQESIPLFRGQSVIKLTDILPDLATPLGTPSDSFGEEIDGARIENGFLCLPYGFSGEVNLFYRCVPRCISSADSGQELDIADRYGHLLSLLVASYLWLDDEEEKAVWYRSLYNEEADRLEKEERRFGDSRIKDVLGWC